MSQFLGGKESLLKVIADLGGRDTDLRQQNVSDLPDTSVSQIWKLLSDSSLGSIVSKYLAENSSKQPVAYDLISPQVKEETEIPNSAHIENTQFKDPESPAKLGIDGLCLPYSVDVPSSEANADRMLHFKVRTFF